jgi:hypothetical protein
MLLVDGPYAEDVEAVKSRDALSAFPPPPQLIWILGEINSEARL